MTILRLKGLAVQPGSQILVISERELWLYPWMDALGPNSAKSCRIMSSVTTPFKTSRNGDNKRWTDLPKPRGHLSDYPALTLALELVHSCIGAVEHGFDKRPDDVARMEYERCVYGIFGAARASPMVRGMRDSGWQKPLPPSITPVPCSQNTVVQMDQVCTLPLPFLHVACLQYQWSRGPTRTAE